MTVKSARAKICIIYTGGTIGMQKTNRGYVPKKGHLEHLLRQIPAFSSTELPLCTFVEFDPLLDSSDMRPSDWRRIAGVVEEKYHDFDGFLVLHGTDTMAYSAAALSFMLEDLRKPVILTGSQIPLEELRNDAHDNLLGALLILQRFHTKLHEVFLYFDNRLLRGNRCTKSDASGLRAFESPNFPVVGEVGIDVSIDWTHTRTASAPAIANAPPRVTPMGDATVASFRLFPGLRARYLDAMLQAPVQGVVLECYGSGNAPARDRNFIRAIADATARGVVIVAVTQPLKGSANLGLYATGKALQDAGVVSGYDMTAEAALAKLFYLFGRGLDPATARAELQRDLRGELTEPLSSVDT